MNKNSIWAKTPAKLWAEGYPIGNGRLGAMILGQVNAERVALNHDRLWRRYWKYQDRNLADIFPEYQQLCLEGKFDQAIELMKDNVIIQAQGYYVNPFVPSGDMGIYPSHGKGVEIINYCRRLNMDNGLVDISYSADEVDFRREYLSSWPAGVMAINLSASKPGKISGEYSLYRLPDIECEITGRAEGNQLVLEGCFDEGVKFSVVVRAIINGGDLKTGRNEYVQPDGQVAQKYDKFAFGFREFEHPAQPCGVSLKVENADAVTLLVAIATDRISDGDLVEYCIDRLDSASGDYAKIKADHIADYKEQFDRVSFSLSNSQQSDKTLRELVENARANKQADASMFERMFNLGRYLGISAGRPAKTDESQKLPINLQGIWNEDPRPAWDSDYHLDLNLQMCYWGFGMVNLANMGQPLADWAWNLLPQARHCSADMFGLDGALYTAVCDAENLGNFDDLFMLATGTNAWLAQSLWQVWEYSYDQTQLCEKIYPVISEIGKFYEGFFREDSHGRLVTAPSGSPENIPTGREISTILSAMSTFDIELLRELFKNLVSASKLLKVDTDKQNKWLEILEKLPLPTINDEGRLLEWLNEDYATVDPGHRHRSHLVGICPGQRITVEDTPDYADAVTKALNLRHSHGGKGSCTLDVASDAQIYARLYKPAEALGKLNDIVANHAMGNLMLCLCDWRPESGLRWFGDRRVFQVEASFGVMASITEMIVQDMRGLIRILPALPQEWPDGDMKGILCRGGFEVDIKWQDGKMTSTTIKSLRGNNCRIKIFGGIKNVKFIHSNYTQKLCSKKGLIEFPTIANETYKILCDR